jgi:hypothetical protein
VDGDVLVHAGDDFGLVVAVIDDRFVQAAVARCAMYSMPSELSTSVMKSPPLVD